MTEIAILRPDLDSLYKRVLRHVNGIWMDVAERKFPSVARAKGRVLFFKLSTGFWQAGYLTVFFASCLKGCLPVDNFEVIMPPILSESNCQ